MFRELSENDYTNILALTTFSNEAYNGRLRHFSFNNNSAIKAEGVLRKFFLMDMLQ